MFSPTKIFKLMVMFLLEISRQIMVEVLANTTSY